MTKTYQTKSGPAKVETFDKKYNWELRRYSVTLPCGSVVEIIKEEHTTRTRAKRPGRQASRTATSIVYTANGTRYSRLIDAIEASVPA